MLVAAGLSPIKPPSVQRIGTLPASRIEALQALYLRLGGDVDRFGLARPGGWDLAFDDGLLVELDEQQHFNRYRATTLSAPWASALPWANDYLLMCRNREADCLRHGTGQARWTNDSAERFFGPAGSRGDLEGIGSPRWRQRAFYDSVKDSLPSRRFSRVSVHDEIEGRSLESILRAEDRDWAGRVSSLVLRRAADGDVVEFRFNT
jgi:hypothetical protein